MISLLLRQLDGSSIHVSVSDDASLETVKYEVVKKAQSADLKPLIFIFAGKPCPENLKLAEFLPSIADGLTVLQRGGMLISLKPAETAAKTSEFLEIDKGVSSLLVSSPLSSPREDFTGFPAPNSKRSGTSTLDYSLGTLDKHGTTVPVVVPSLPEADWAVALPLRARIRTILDETLVIPLPQASARADITITDLKQLIYDATGMPVAHQQLHVGARPVSPSQDALSIRSLQSKESASQVLDVTLSYAEAAIFSSTAGWSTREALQAFSKSADFDSKLRDVIESAYLPVLDAEGHASNPFMPIAEDGAYGNDAKSCRLRGVCSSCNIIGAHFEPRALCPMCVHPHEAVSIVAGFLPSPRVTPSRLDETVYLPSKTYKWRDLMGISIRCSECSYVGPAKIGFLCRAARIGTETYASDYDIPPVALDAASASQVVQYCPSRLYNHQQDAASSQISNMPPEFFRGGVQKGGEDVEDPCVPWSGVVSPDYHFPSARALSLVSQLRASISSLVTASVSS